jgi:hypothetical protein
MGRKKTKRNGYLVQDHEDDPHVSLWAGRQHAKGVTLFEHHVSVSPVDGDRIGDGQLGDEQNGRHVCQGVLPGMPHGVYDFAAEDILVVVTHGPTIGLVPLWKRFANSLPMGLACEGTCSDSTKHRSNRS